MRDTSFRNKISKKEFFFLIKIVVAEERNENTVSSIADVRKSFFVKSLRKKQFISSEVTVKWIFNKSKLSATVHKAWLSSQGKRFALYFKSKWSPSAAKNLFLNIYVVTVDKITYNIPSWKRSLLKYKCLGKPQIQMFGKASNPAIHKRFPIFHLP